MPTTLRKSADPLAAKADLLVVCVASDRPRLAGPAAAVDAALGGVVARAVKDGEVDGKPRSSALFHAAAASPPRGSSSSGIGEGGADDWRAAGSAAAASRGQGPARAASRWRRRPSAGAAEVGALIEGLGTGHLPLRPLQDHRRGEARGAAGAPGRGPLGRPSGRPTCAGADRIVEAVNGARDLSNTPSNHLTPTDLADHAKALADATPGLTCTVLGRARLEKLGAGALLGVAQGSDEPPRMIVLRYRPADAAPPRRGARARGQGRHVRHRRHLHQAVGRHGGDEAGHGRRRGGARGHRAGRRRWACRSRSSP